MKKIVLICLFAMLAVGSYAQRGLASGGARLGYALDNEAAALGFDYRYAFLPDFRLAPSVTFVLPNHGLRACYLDMDFHYIVQVADIFDFYPIGGVSLSFWDRDGHETATRLGLNIGLGAELRLSREISVGLDMKYNVVTDYDQALTVVRVAYHF